MFSIRRLILSLRAPKGRGNLRSQIASPAFGRLAMTGFTLVEQLIVIALIVAVVGFGAIQMSHTFQSNSSEHAVKDLTSVLRFLQMKAIEEGRIYQLSISEDERSLTVKREEKGQDELMPFKSSLIQSVRFGKSLRLSLERDQNLFFYPDGFSSKNRFVITKSNQDRITLELKNRLGSVEVSGV